MGVRRRVLAAPLVMTVALTACGGDGSDGPATTPFNPQNTTAASPPLTSTVNATTAAPLVNTTAPTVPPSNGG